MRVRGAYGFGIARSLDVSASRPRLAEICEIASRATGVVLFPHHALTYRELSESIVRGDLGAAWMPPMSAIELEDRQQATILALPVRRGLISYHAAIIARPGKDATRTLASLKGKRAAWVDRDSAAGYIVPRMHLLASGLDATALFSHETFLHSHEAVIDAVVGGQADVGATFCTLDARTGRISNAGFTTADGRVTRDVDVLATPGPIPNDAIVVSNQLPIEARQALLRWLLALDARGKELFGELVRAEGFRTAQPSHFEALRRLLEQSKSLGQGPPSSRRVSRT
jgi:phosphonate transport system substrate-binding protein